jgi:hypothetical protein
VRNLLVLLGIASSSMACGSGGGTNDGGAVVQPVADGATARANADVATGACSAITPLGASVSWLENGTAECAYVVVATRMTSASQDFLEIVASTTSGIGLALTVVSYASTLGGTYECKSDAGIASQYVDFVYPGSSLVDCTITITNPGAPGGANAVGTFSATLAATGGGTTTITRGTFNTPVTATTG